MSDRDETRWLRLRAKTFRWNDGLDVEGYCAAEVTDGEVVWSTWSHRHGGGPCVLGRQRLAELRRDGPPFSVPSAILRSVERALGASEGSD